MGKFLLKNAVLGVLRSNKTPIFPHKAFRLFVVAEMFLEVAFFLETYVVLKNAGCTSGRTPWLADKGTFGFWNSQNILSINDSIVSNLSIVHSHDT